MESRTAQERAWGRRHTLPRPACPPHRQQRGAGALERIQGRTAASCAGKGYRPLKCLCRPVFSFWVPFAAATLVVACTLARLTAWLASSRACWTNDPPARASSARQRARRIRQRGGQQQQLARRQRPTRWSHDGARSRSIVGRWDFCLAPSEFFSRDLQISTRTLRWCAQPSSTTYRISSCTKRPAQLSVACSSGTQHGTAVR